MAACEKIRFIERKLCAGDLRNIITLQNRSITAPNSGVDFGESFSGDIDVWAACETKNGVSIFDETNVEKVVTHVFGIRYDSGITAETWILFEGRRLDIFNVEDLDERHEWMILTCGERGDESKSVNVT